MLAKIRKLNVVPFRLTALVLLTVVAITLLNACGGGDSGEDRPTLTITPIPRTITTSPPPGSTQKLKVIDNGMYQNMRFAVSEMPEFDTVIPTGRTYTAKSLVEEVATAEADRGGMVTVTAMKRGSAEITITANGDAASPAASTLARSVSAPSIRAVAAYSFTVEVENRAPTVANPIPDQTDAAVGTAFRYTFPENTFDDADDDPLSYTASEQPDVAWLTFTAATRTFSGTPAANTAGTITVTVTAADGNGGSVTDEFTIGVNRPPVAVGTIAAVNLTVGDSAAIRDVASDFSDPDNDSLTYSASTSVPSVATARVSGSVVTVTPVAVGSATITVTAQDPDGLSATQTTAVTVVAANQAPTAVGAVAAVNLTVGGSAITRDVAPNFSDPDNDSLIFTASTSAPSVATARVSGSVVTVTPVAGGSATITVTAQDPDNLSATQTIVVTVVAANQAPTVVGTVAAVNLTVGGSATTRDVAPNFSDPDNDSLSFTASTTAPSVATARVIGSVVTVTPVAAGNAAITVTAQDPDNLSATQTIAVTVVAANQAPTAVGTVAAVNLTVGGSATTRDVAPNFSDPDNDSLTFTTSTLAPLVVAASVNGSVVTVTPVAVGSTTITVTAQDPDGLSATQTIAVAVAAAAVNQAPTAVGTIAAVTLTVGRPAVTRDVTTNFNDPDNDSLAFTVSSLAPAVATASVSGSEVTVTPVATGSATITVTAQDSGGLNATQTIAVTVNPAPAPDLIVSSISVIDPTLTVEKYFTLDATVRNQGTGTAASTTLRYYRSLDSTISSSDPEVGDYYHDARPLAASITRSDSTGLITPSSAGTYYYGACVAPVNGESDTSNNCSTGVSVVVSAPDLIVEFVSASPSNLGAGALFTLTTKVINQGAGTAESLTLRYYRSTDATISRDDIQEDTDLVESLAASAASSQSSNLTAPSSVGTYYYGACVESMNEESDTSNNCSAGGPVVVSAPDLVVESVTVTDASLTVGNPFTLGVTVRNLGAGVATQTILTYYRSSDSTISSGDTPVGTDSVVPLAASATSTESILLNPSMAGTYYYGACVGFANGESDRSNNCSTGVAVVVSVPPSSISASVSGFNGEAGDSFTLSVTVSYSGTGPTESTTVKYYRSSNSSISSGDTKVGTVVSIPSRSAPTNVEESTSLSAPSSPGSYYYGACAETAATPVCSDGVEVVVIPPQ